MQFSPSVDEYVVVSNYTGQLLTVEFSTSDDSQLFQWQVSADGTVLSKSFSFEECNRNRSITLPGFSAQCNLQQWSSEVTISAEEPLNNSFNLSLALTDHSFALSFSREIKIGGKYSFIGTRKNTSVFETHTHTHNGGVRN